MKENEPDALSTLIQMVSLSDKKKYIYIYPYKAFSNTHEDKNGPSDNIGHRRRRGFNLSWSWTAATACVTHSGFYKIFVLVWTRHEIRINPVPGSTWLHLDATPNLKSTTQLYCQSLWYWTKADRSLLSVPQQEQVSLKTTVSSGDALNTGAILGLARNWNVRWRLTVRQIL